MLRLGFTESALLFFFYLDNILDFSNKDIYRNHQEKYINWLYSTSGFYDREINGDYFNFDPIIIKKSPTYNAYFFKLLEVLKNYKYNVVLCLIKFEFLEIELESFFKYINYHEKINKYTTVLNCLDNKKVLIINNLGSLMKKQFESGNINLICPEFPKNVRSIDFYENGYSFLNNGNDDNILDTCKKICTILKSFEFDVAVISCGAYSCLFADYISEELKKEIYVVDGMLPEYFGIITNRCLKLNNNVINEYFINVPDEMKPPNYLKIEDGCYW
tara:strand:- start:5 stop:826 length:822 start_codon:yes stop_codon:yes gene_type:complete